MATAKILPSGQYRCRAYVGTVNGKKIIKSFTAPTKAQAEYLASQYILKKPLQGTCDSMTFGEALEKYISGRESILSPATIRGYRQYADHNFDKIKDRLLEDLTQDDIQNFVNDACESGLSSKTVRNIHGLISAVFKKYRKMHLDTTLPAKVKPDLYIPSDKEVVKVISYVRAKKDRDMLIAILLAAYGPMRRSEICALTDADVSGDVIHVNKARVHKHDNTWTIKHYPKTEAGDRFISMPAFVIKELKGIKGPLVSLTPDLITDYFAQILKRAGVPHFRFHDLRHYSASIQHAIGIPDAYIMQRGGWESDTVLKQIYRHAMDQETKKNNDKVNKYFSKIQNS